MVAPDNKQTKATGSPLVSIITPVLNGTRYLEACIQSVLDQSYPHIEHIFIDGGSVDGTVEVLSDYQARYPERIRLISDPGKNAREAWNKGLMSSKGDILGWLGSDDTYEPGAIKTIVEFFHANPEARFVFGNCHIIDERGEIIKTYRGQKFDLKEAISNSCPIPCPSAFYQREVIDRVGLMYTKINACDLDYWMRVGKVFPVFQIDEVISNFRKHKESVSGSEQADKMYAREGFIISRRNGGSLFSARARRYYMHESVVLLWLYRYIVIPYVLPVMIRLYRPVKRRRGR